MWSKLIQWVLDIFANPNSKSSNSMMNIILFGPPGSGKGTQANSIAKKYNLLHISTGDLFRYEIGNSTELGQLAKSYINKGELVPDDVTIGMLKNKVDAYPDVAGYMEFKASHYEKWLSGMRKLRAKIVNQLGDTKLSEMHKWI